MAERWITWRGRHILVDDDGKVAIKSKTKELTTKDYEKLSNEIDDNLTEDEREQLHHYSVGAGYSMDANDPRVMRTYLFKDDSEQGYREERISFGDITSGKYELDKSLHYRQGEYYTRNSFNYDRYKDATEQFKQLDKIFNEKGIRSNDTIMLYRRGWETKEDIEAGFIRKGYTSTTIRSNIGKKTPGGLELGDKEFVIALEPDTPFIPLGNIADKPVQYQKEVLLPRNIQYEYINSDGNIMYVKAKVVK